MARTGASGDVGRSSLTRPSGARPPAPVPLQRCVEQRLGDRDLGGQVQHRQRLPRRGVAPTLGAPPTSRGGTMPVTRSVTD